MLARATPVTSPMRSPSSRRAGILAARSPARLILDVTTDRCGGEGGPADYQPSRPPNTDEVPGQPRMRSRYVAWLREVAPNASAQPTASPRKRTAPTEVVQWVSIGCCHVRTWSVHPAWWNKGCRGLANAATEEELSELYAVVRRRCE